MSEEQLIPTPSVFGETGNFLLERELGRGGMGGVYMGRDKMLDRPVAVKVMLREYGNDDNCSGQPFPSPGDLPDPGTEPTSPALQADCLPLSHRGKR